MQTNIRKDLIQTAAGQTADRVLRNCVHCGFCTATCPTYQLLGDELDGPRGRIYLTKQLLEGKPATAKTRLHLDRCLTCRSCETTCPSGVKYSHLLDIGRDIVNKETRRPLYERILRQGLLWALPNPIRFNKLMSIASRFRFILPGGLKKSVPERIQAVNWPETEHPRKVILLEGCVQPTLSPEINQATVSLLNKLGVQSIRPTQSCCGALAHHLTAEQQALLTIKNNIDAWWPHIEQGVEAIVSNASGCGVMIKDYGHLMREHGDYAEKAKTISALCKDISEIIQNENLGRITGNRKISFQSPCTLQHGQQLNGVVESILQKAGFRLLEYKDKHLCCGSAGTYSITQKKISQRLLENKLQNLLRPEPQLITTANIGCLLHLRSKSPVPVLHWVELLDRELS